MLFEHIKLQPYTQCTFGL